MGLALQSDTNAFVIEYSYIQAMVFKKDIENSESVQISVDAVAQSVQRMTPGEEVVDSIPQCGRPLPTGWVGVSIM